MRSSSASRGRRCSRPEEASRPRWRTHARAVAELLLARAGEAVAERLLACTREATAELLEVVRRPQALAALADEDRVAARGRRPR